MPADKEIPTELAALILSGSDYDWIEYIGHTVAVAMKAAKGSSSLSIDTRMPHIEPYIIYRPRVAMFYILTARSSRWPEAEQYILADPELGPRFRRMYPDD